MGVWKKNQNTPRPSEHPPVMGSKVLWGVVVDSHIQHIFLATEETTMTQQVSHRPIQCQSRLWSQKGTKVNGSNHGNNPLLIPTGIQSPTCQVLRPYKQWHQPMSKQFIKPPYSIPRATSTDWDYCRLPTTCVLSTSKRTNYGPILFINKSKFLKITHCTEIMKLKYWGPWWWRPWAGKAGARASI